jgi:hypothetical protein
MLCKYATIIDFLEKIEELTLDSQLWQLFNFFRLTLCSFFRRGWYFIDSNSSFAVWSLRISSLWVQLCISNTKNLDRTSPTSKSVIDIINTYMGLLQPQNLLLTKPEFHLKCTYPRFGRHNTLFHHLFLSTPDNLRLPYIQSYRGFSTKTNHKITINRTH